MQQQVVERSLSIPERLWLFFVSVKTAIVLIALIAGSSILGSLIPQEGAIPSQQPAQFYPAAYGTYGKIMYALGLTHMYTSTWFIALLLAISVNLIVCSWERLVPLYKSLQKQPIVVQAFLLKHRGLYTSFSADNPSADTAHIREQIISSLGKRRYRIKQDGQAFFAEKGRIARFGPYIIHIGLLLIVAGCLTRLIPGFYYTGDILVDEGQTVQVPHSDFSIRNDQAHEEDYTDGRPKFYQTQATVIYKGQQVLHKPITVNHPLKYHGMILFQSAMLPVQFQGMDLSIVDQQANNAKVGSLHMDFNDPQQVYHVGAYQLTVLNYFPDFQFVQNNQPSSKSSTPYNPALIFKIEGPGITSDIKEWFVPSAPFLQAELAKSQRFNFQPDQVNLAQTTGFRVQKDFGIPIVYGGCAIVVLGLVITFYIQHRTLWGNLSEGVLHLGGQTNKNWYGFQQELQRVLASNQLNQKFIRNKGGTA